MRAQAIGCEHGCDGQPSFSRMATAFRMSADRGPQEFIYLFPVSWPRHRYHSCFPSPIHMLEMFDFSRLLRWLFPDRRQRLSLADLEDMDVSVHYPLGLLDQEKFVLQDGEVAGTTGIIDGSSVTKTNGRDIEGYFFVIEFLIRSRVATDFIPDKDYILAASRATSLLMIEGYDSKGRRSLEFATAFFIAPSLLLTAGHAAVSPNGLRTELYLFHPGTTHLDFSQVAKRSPSAIRCAVVVNHYSGVGFPSNDIAILSSGNFESAHFLTLSGEGIPLDRNVDIIGYPGEIRDMWLSEKHDGLADVSKNKASGEVLLPPRQLVVTRGIVAHNSGSLVSYTISTCPGLSGSCVMFEGKVHGK